MDSPKEQRRFAPETGVATPPLQQTGYGALVLERLARQVCRIAGVEWSCIFVRDRRDPRSVIAAAGHGLPWDLVGARVGADEGALASVLRRGEPSVVEDYTELVGALQAPVPYRCAGAAVPIKWNGEVSGALSAAGIAPERGFGTEQLELLVE